MTEISPLEFDLQKQNDSTSETSSAAQAEGDSFSADAEIGGDISTIVNTAETDKLVKLTASTDDLLHMDDSDSHLDKTRFPQDLQINDMDDNSFNKSCKTVPDFSKDEKRISDDEDSLKPGLTLDHLDVLWPEKVNDILPQKQSCVEHFSLMTLSEDNETNVVEAGISTFNVDIEKVDENLPDEPLTFHLPLRTENVDELANPLTAITSELISDDSRQDIGANGSEVESLKLSENVVIVPIALSASEKVKLEVRKVADDADQNMITEEVGSKELILSESGKLEQVPSDTINDELLQKVEMSAELITDEAPEYVNNQKVEVTLNMHKEEVPHDQFQLSQETSTVILETAEDKNLRKGNFYESVVSDLAEKMEDVIEQEQMEPHTSELPKLTEKFKITLSVPEVDEGLAESDVQPYVNKDFSEVDAGHPDKVLEEEFAIVGMSEIEGVSNTTEGGIPVTSETIFPLEKVLTEDFPRVKPTGQLPVMNENFGFVSPTFTREVESVIAFDDEPAMFECEVTGCPVPMITWFVAGIPLKNSKDFKITLHNNIAKLVICKVYPDDEGDYTCRAENEVGVAETTASLVVEGTRMILTVDWYDCFKCKG